MTRRRRAAPAPNYRANATSLAARHRQNVINVRVPKRRNDRRPYASWFETGIGRVDAWRSVEARPHRPGVRRNTESPERRGQVRLRLSPVCVFHSRVNAVATRVLAGLENVMSDRTPYDGKPYYCALGDTSRPCSAKILPSTESFEERQAFVAHRIDCGRWRHSAGAKLRENLNSALRPGVYRQIENGR
jgi:hypothetical protein